MVFKKDKIWGNEVLLYQSFVVEYTPLQAMELRCPRSSVD